MIKPAYMHIAHKILIIFFLPWHSGSEARSAVEHKTISYLSTHVKPLEKHIPKSCEDKAKPVFGNTHGSSVRRCALHLSSKCLGRNSSVDEMPEPKSEQRIVHRVHAKLFPAWTSPRPALSDYKFFINRMDRAIKEKCFVKARPCLDSNRVPYFATRSWGTCALVGLGDNLLYSHRGQDIDQHDLVIRLGHLPIKGVVLQPKTRFISDGLG
ncbi:unnamed protein product [Bathycoccus prasinos]